MKSNKGITLVALVITIIVLLILAGVSISLVVGDNGVLTQAKTSSDSTKISQMKEALGVAISSVQAKHFANYAQNASSEFDTTINTLTVNEALSQLGFNLCNNSFTIYDTATGFDETDGTPCYVTDGTNYLAVTITKNNIGLTLSGWGGNLVAKPGSGD